VPEDVREDPFVGDRRNRLGRDRSMDRQALSKAVSTHRAAPCVEEQMITAACGPHRKPVPDHRSGYFPQRQDALASSLAGDTDGIEVRVPESGDHDVNQLRDPEARGITQVQHCAVPPAGCGCGIRGLKQRLDFLTFEMGDGRDVMALHRHGVHLLRQIEAGRHAVFEISEERLDRREPHIAGAGGVVPLCLEMIEEGEEQFRREMFDHDRAGSGTEPIGCEAEQQHEAVGIAGHGMTAGIALARQVFAKERAETRSELGHDATLPV